jgi:lantibiotic modifying enzyme
MEPSRALERAVEAAAFIESQRDGSVWRRSDEPDAKVDHTLYHGTAGIIVFLLELSDATDNERYRLDATQAGVTLAERVMTWERNSVAFATGWPGVAFVLGVLHQRTGDPRFLTAARHAMDCLLAQSTALGDHHGIGWIEPMPFSDITGFHGDREIYDLSVGAAGAALALISAADARIIDNGLERAAAVAARLLEVGERTGDGTRWGLMSDMPFAFTAPNFAHGGAGVGYLMARLAERTGDRAHLDAAISAADYVIARMTEVGDGALVCHTEEQQPPHFYLGMCHGPAGTGRLFALLQRLTGDARFGDALSRMRRGLDGIGAPETRSWGWWNNHSRCCGDAGLGDAALLYAASTANETSRSWLTMAHRSAAVLETTSAIDDGCRSWTQAEHRARPAFVQRQTGYMQGAAGIGSFLVHLADPTARIALPDDIV